jgi:hypothetical protein
MIKKTNRKRAITRAPKKFVPKNISIQYGFDEEEGLEVYINIPAIKNDADFIKYSNQLGSLLSGIHSGDLTQVTKEIIQQTTKEKPELSEFLEHAMTIWQSLDEPEDESPVITPLSFDFENH